MPGPLRIFISSTMEDLKDERKAVVARLKLFNFEPVNAERILPNGATSWGRIDEELKTCHLSVLILGKRYGWVPKNGPLAAQKISVTHGEYRLAKKLGIPVLPFYMDLGKRAGAVTPDAQMREKFRTEVGNWVKGQFRTEFDGTLDLARKVGSAVTGLLSDTYQRGRVEQRVKQAPSEPPRPRHEAPMIIPPALERAVRDGRTVLFVGSGISMAAGLPSSSAFEAQLERGLAEVYKEYAAPPVGAALASVAADFESEFGRRKLAAQVKLMLELPGGTRPTPAHLAAIGRFPKIITTNYDRLFAKAIARRKSAHKVVVAPDSPPALPKQFVLHLHGSIAQPDTLVISETDLAKFEITRARVLKQVSALLASRSVVVAGTTLRDPSIYRLFQSLRGRLHGFCLMRDADRLAQRRLQWLGLEPVEGSIESLVAALP